MSKFWFVKQNFYSTLRRLCKTYKILTLRPFEISTKSVIFVFFLFYVSLLFVFQKYVVSDVQWQRPGLPENSFDAFEKSTEFAIRSDELLRSISQDGKENITHSLPKQLLRKGTLIHPDRTANADFLALLPQRNGEERDRIVEQLQYTVNTSSVKLIVLAGTHSIASARTRLKNENCNVDACVFTRDYSRLYHADAILMTGMAIPGHARPNRRRRRQVRIQGCCTRVQCHVSIFHVWLYIQSLKHENIIFVHSYSFEYIDACVSNTC